MSRNQALVGLLVALGIPVGVWWWVAGTHTNFAPEFSSENFERVQLRQSKAEVLQLLGPPLRTLTEQRDEQWCYPRKGGAGLSLELGNSQVADATGDDWCVFFGDDGLLAPEFRKGLGALNRDQVRLAFGPPPTTWSKGLHERLIYSEPARPRTNWEWREVDLQAGEVCFIVDMPIYE